MSGTITRYTYPSGTVVVPEDRVYDHVLRRIISHEHAFPATAVSATPKILFDSYVATVDPQLSAMASSSAYWNSVYSTVSASSGMWGGGSGAVSYADLMYVSGQVSGKLDASVYSGASGAWDSAYSTVGSNSAAWSAGGASGSVYTGTAERTVGGITDGQVFLSASMTQMWDSLIKQEKFPVIVAPASTFASTVEGYREVGEIIASVAFSSAFSMGSITPQYTAASPYRSGPPNAHQYTGTGLSTVATTAMTDAQSVTGYTVLINGQSWQGRVAYDAGVQPKSSYDNDYLTPLAAGQTAYVTRTITGVYPYYATTVDIATLTKQALASHASAYVQTNAVAEDDLGNKQSADFPAVWSSITGVQFYNTINATWEWIGGTKANSLLTFSVTATTHVVQGATINYSRYANNGSKSGARQLRWYTT